MNGGRVGVVGLTVAVAFAVGSALMLFGRQPVPGVDAQPSPASGVSAWVGTYRNRAGDGGAAAIGSAVDAGIESMGPLVERIARRRILASNPPFQTLRIRRPQRQPHKKRQIWIGRFQPGAAKQFFTKNFQPLTRLIWHSPRRQIQQITQQINE